MQSLMSFEKDVFSLIANNAKLYVKGAAGKTKLTPVEKLAFDRIVGVQMSLTFSAYVQYQNGLMDDEVWDAYNNALKKYLQSPGFLVSWKSFEMHYPLSFRAMVNDAFSLQTIN